MSTSENYYEAEDESPGIPAQLRHPIRAFRRQFRLILAVLLLLLIVTAVATAYYPLKYEAQATILMTAKSVPDEFVPTTNIANILEEFDAIRGTVFLRANLAKIISDTGVYAKERETTTVEELTGRLAQELTVTTETRVSRGQPAPHSITFEVKMAGKDPQTLAAVVNRMVAELIDANIDYRSRQARISTTFMEREYQRADEALRVHERELARFRADNRGALPEEQASLTSKLERLEVQRGNAILLVSEYQAQLDRIAARPHAMSEDEALQTLRDRLATSKAIYTDDHPIIISLERQVAAREASESGAEPSAGSAAFEERETLEKGIATERMRLGQIDDTVRDLEEKLAAAPLIAEEYGAMVRKGTILQENHDEYLRKLKNAELALSLERSQQGAKLIRLDQAVPPTSPIVPRWLVAFAGGVVSIGVAVLLGAMRELFFPVVVDDKHLEDAIEVPCLGSMPEIA